MLPSIPKIFQPWKVTERPLLFHTVKKHQEMWIVFSKSETPEILDPKEHNEIQLSKETHLKKVDGIEIPTKKEKEMESNTERGEVSAMKERFKEQKHLAIGYPEESEVKKLIESRNEEWPTSW